MKFTFLMAITNAVKMNDSKSWIMYRSSRGEQDCNIDESKNWLGNTLCAYSWECQGARMCTRGGYKKDDGWCSGDSLCPQLGPLDYYDENHDVVWNHGSPRNWEGVPNNTYPIKVKN